MTTASDKVERNLPGWALTLRSARAKTGMTQSMLAQFLRVSQSTITAWENGKTRPPIEKWKLLDVYLESRVSLELSQTVDFLRNSTSEDPEPFFRSRVKFFELTPSSQYRILFEKLLVVARDFEWEAEVGEVAEGAYQIYLSNRENSTPSMLEANLAFAVERWRLHLATKFEPRKT